MSGIDPNWTAGQAVDQAALDSSYSENSTFSDAFLRAIPKTDLHVSSDRVGSPPGPPPGPDPTPRRPWRARLPPTRAHSPLPDRTQSPRPAAGVASRALLVAGVAWHAASAPCADRDAV